MAALAEAFVRVRADTSSFRDDIRRGLDREGRDSGSSFGKRFNTGFSDALRGSGGIGDVAGRVIGAITPHLGKLVSGFTAVAGSVGGLVVSLGKLGVAAVAVSTLAAGTAAATASMVALAGAILPVSGLIAALPGVITGFVAINTVLKLSLYSVGDAMKAAYEGNMEDFDDAMLKLTDTAKSFANEFLATVPAMKEFQRAAQDGFFGELNGSLARFVELLSATQPKIVELASELGKWARELAVFATAEQTIGQLNTILGLTRDALADLRQALHPVLTGFLDLGVVGTGFLRSLAPGIAAAATQFGAFLSEAARSGQALEWMSTGLVVLKQLAGVIQEVSGILGAVFRAAATAGGDALGGVVTVLQNINAALSSAAGQDAMVQVFQSLQKVGKALGPVIDALLTGLGTIAPAVADIAVALGPILASAIKSLAPALAALAPGLLAIVAGIGAAVAALGPSLAPIGRAIGTAFAAIAPVIAALGSAFALIAPQLALVVAGFAPLVATIINALAPALAALEPGLVTIGVALANAFANPLVSAALLTLGQGISNLLVAVAPILPVIIELAAVLVERLGTGLVTLAAFLTPVIAALADALAPILPVIAKLFQDISAALLPVAAQLGGELAGALRAVSAVLTPVAEQFGAALAGALRDLMPHIRPIMDALREVGGEILAAILQVLPQLIPHFRDLAVAFAGLFVEVAKILPDLIRFGGEILVAIIGQLPVLIPMIKDLALQFIAVLKAITPLIPPLLKLLLEIILPLIPELPKLLPPLLDLVRVFADLLLKAAPLISKLLESETVATIVKIGAKNMVLAFDLVRDAINLAVGAIQILLGVFIGLPGQAEAGLSKMGLAIKGWANSIIGWFESVINILASAIPGLSTVTFPRLANGAIVDKATMAMVGEAGKEVVIPLTRPARARELAEKSGLLDILAGMKVPELSAGRRLALAGAPATSGAAAGGPPWSDRPLIGTYVAAAGQTAQKLMSDLRVEAIGASW